MFSSCRKLNYQTIAFRAKSEWALNVLDIETFLQSHLDTKAVWYIHQIRNLEFHAPIQIARFNRCAYYNAFRNCADSKCRGVLGTSNEAKAHEQFLDDISRQVQIILDSLQADQLQTFV